MFKFTFNVNGGAFNPFAQTEKRDGPQVVVPQTIARKLPAPPRPCLPATDDGAPISRKRGWTPMTSAPSAPESQPMQTTGWIDTPSRYLEAASQSHQNRGDVDGELPPAKKRKTLTDSILSTALSAALIGTTVGMTAYRMWRDRGKSGDAVSTEMMMDPPPPYAKEEWVDDTPKPKPAVRSPRSSRKPRPVTRRTPRSRMVPIATSPVRLPPAHSPLHRPSSSTPTAVEQNEPDTEERGHLDEQMDWMSDKIRKLIEEGQKALGKEVVVMSDDPDDKDGAVDDGQEGWEEVDDSLRAGPSSPTSPSHLRRTRKQPTPFVPSVPPAAWGGSKVTACDNDRSTLPQSRTLRTGLSGRPGKETREVKVLYEPSSLAVPGPVVKELINDQVSASLSEQARKIRQAYQIH